MRGKSMGAAATMSVPALAMVAAMALLAACAPCGQRPGSHTGVTPDSAAAAGRSGPPRVLTRLYFGTDSPQGAVSDKDFEAFLDSAITPRFPAGLTRFRADGQWTSTDGKLVKEKSWVVELIRPDAASEAAKVDAVVASYKRRFEQEAVLRVEERPTIRF